MLLPKSPSPSLTSLPSSSSTPSTSLSSSPSLLASSSSSSSSSYNAPTTQKMINQKIIFVVAFVLSCEAFSPPFPNAKKNYRSNCGYRNSVNVPFSSFSSSTTTTTSLSFRLKDGADVVDGSDGAGSILFHNHRSNGQNGKHSISKSRRMSCSYSCPSFSSSSSTSTALYFFGKKSEDVKEKEEPRNKKTTTNSENSPDDDDEIVKKLSSWYSSLTKEVPQQLPAAFSFLKVAFPSFLAGGIVTLSVLFLPLISDYYDAFNGSSDNFYGPPSTSTTNDGGRGGGGSGGGGSGGGSGSSSNNANDANTASNKGNYIKPIKNINQPVILFETILTDLNEAYVDDVDIQKLFETGVKAMTASLDPYTEFESRLEARELEESVSGRYGGVGLVIRGNNNVANSGSLGGMAAELEDAEDVGLLNLEDDQQDWKGGGGRGGGGGGGTKQQQKGNSKSQPPVAKKVVDDDDEELAERRRLRQKSMKEGIRVVSAFEGYAYDAGLRVGDKILAVDDYPITPTTTVEDVRNHLRGEPGTTVSITFLREGVGSSSTGTPGSPSSLSSVNEPQTVTLTRSVVHIPDVKYFGFIGDPKDGIGYIDLSGFANDAGREVRYAIRALQHGADMASRQNSGNSGEGRMDEGQITMASLDPTKLKGLVLDLRSNPGGLLTSAVDVATLFVPNGSEIVSAKGRGFPETLYRSKTEPVMDPSTRLAVLVNEQTASAAEIVTGAIQDLDVGLVVGKGRTYGKGLVQNVQDLPYQTALKFTVAKYYTPSGRCIQSTVYKEGGRGDDLITSNDGDSVAGKYKATKVADKDRTVFYTAHGRQVKDGGGIEVDYKVEPQKASPTEIVLLNSGAYADFAAEWSRHHELTDDFKLDDATYKDFQKFVENRQKQGDMKLEVLYDSQLKELQKKLKASGFDSSERELEKLRAGIIKDVKKDFKIYKDEIMEDIEQNILARYLPESMLIEHGLKSDVQVAETAKMLKDGKEFDNILARTGDDDKNVPQVKGGGYETVSSKTPESRLQTKW